MSEKDLRISRLLTQWYDINKRELPWRNTNDAYIIWVSEVILQQTRVDQGYNYFNRFVDKFPTVRALANANEEEVLKVWQGLGYYSRARNMHAAAKVINAEFNGVFPTAYKDVLSLKGVGEYTAAAIVSFAYNLPYAVVDGNVYRVLSRLFAISTPINTAKGKKEFSELAQTLLDEDNPGLHNQAMMEFGALQCVPTSPSCIECPASEFCLAFAQRRVKELPVKEKKLKIKERYFYYFDIHCGSDMFLRKRVEKDIWQNLYELPMVEKNEYAEIEDLRGSPEFSAIFGGSEEVYVKHKMQLKHVLSHQIIYASFFEVKVNNISMNDSYIRIDREDVERYPVSRLVHRYLESG